MNGIRWRLLQHPEHLDESMNERDRPDEACRPDEAQRRSGSDIVNEPHESPHCRSGVALLLDPTCSVAWDRIGGG